MKHCIVDMALPVSLSQLVVAKSLIALTRLQGGGSKIESEKATPIVQSGQRRMLCTVRIAPFSPRHLGISGVSAVLRVLVPGGTSLTFTQRLKESAAQDDGRLLLAASEAHGSKWPHRAPSGSRADGSYIEARRQNRNPGPWPS